MSRRVSVAGLLLAWLCAQGALTETVQVFAWSRMFLENAQAMDWRAALEATFDPDKPCAICGVVRKVRDAGPHAPAAPPAGEAEKIILALTTLDEPVPPRSPRMVFAPVTRLRSLWRPPVPKPPPRCAAA